jgi:hypothetical protein
LPVSLDVRLAKIESQRKTDGEGAIPSILFNVSSTISESDRDIENVKLKFEIDIDTDPSVARIQVSGDADVKGSREEITQLLDAKEKDGTPTVFTRIYRQIYPTMFLVAGSLRIPPPTPGLMKVNAIETHEKHLAH